MVRFLKLVKPSKILIKVEIFNCSDGVLLLSACLYFIAQSSCSFILIVCRKLCSKLLSKLSRRNFAIRGQYRNIIYGRGINVDALFVLPLVEKINNYQYRVSLVHTKVGGRDYTLIEFVCFDLPLL